MKCKKVKCLESITTCFYSKHSQVDVHFLVNKNTLMQSTRNRQSTVLLENYEYSRTFLKMVELNVMNSHNYHKKILIWVIVNFWCMSLFVSLVFTLLWAGRRITSICSMSLTVTQGEGTTVITITSNPKSKCPRLCQILVSLLCSPVCFVSEDMKEKLTDTQRTFGVSEKLALTEILIDA